MAKNLNKPEIELIRTLKKLKSEDQKSIIKYLDETALNLIGECFHNILSTNLRLKKRDKKRLKEKLHGNEKLIRYISNKNRPLEKRRQKLTQSGKTLLFIWILIEIFFLRRTKSFITGGAILSTILGVALPFLIEFIARKISGK